jgi:hypothetical protein
VVLVSGDVKRVAAELVGHAYTYPDSFCECGTHLAEPWRDWQTHLAQALLAPGGVVAGMVAEAWNEGYSHCFDAADEVVSLRDNPYRAALADPDTAATGAEPGLGAPRGVAPVPGDPGDEVGPENDAERPDPIIRYADMGDREEFDEFIAYNATVHFEAMGDAEFWIGVTLPDGRSWAINCGAKNSRAKGYAICEED